MAGGVAYKDPRMNVSSETKRWLHDFNRIKDFGLTERQIQEAEAYNVPSIFVVQNQERASDLNAERNLWESRKLAYDYGRVFSFITFSAGVAGLIFRTIADMLRDIKLYNTSQSVMKISLALASISIGITIFGYCSSNKKGTDLIKRTVGRDEVKDLVYPVSKHDDFIQRYPEFKELIEKKWPEDYTVNNNEIEKIRKINKGVNKSIQYKYDIEQYGIEEYHALPKSGYGDCEDFALEKMFRLMKAGVSPKKMSMAYVGVNEEINSDHAVLLVHTSKGPLILDSIVNAEGKHVDEIKYLTQTNYRLYYMQNPNNHVQWFGIHSNR
jgi:predicted transglutaminase-like cysteine proteinase